LCDEQTVERIVVVGRYQYRAAISWVAAEPKVIWEGVVEVGAHPDLASMSAERPFLGRLDNRYQFGLRLVIMGDHDFLTLFHQADQFEEMTFRLLYGDDFRGHSFHHF
jgi:hypothetical protein